MPNLVMSLRIYVDAYSGYKASERPLRFTLDDETYHIASVEDRWQEPNSEYFKGENHRWKGVCAALRRARYDR